MWFLEVGTGLGQRGQRGGKLQVSYQVLFVFKMMTTFEVMVVNNMVLYIVDKPLTFTLKSPDNYLNYIRRLTYWEILELGVFDFLNIAMFVVKKTDFKIVQQKIST